MTPDFADWMPGRASPPKDTQVMTTSGMPNTKAAGDITEAVVLAEFLRAGFPVCVPFGDNRRYDLVIEASGRFLRVQCKTASLTSDRCGGKGCIRFKGLVPDGGPGS